METTIDSQSGAIVVPSFAAMGLHPSVVQPITDRGHEKPTPIQEEAIPLVLQGRDVIGEFSHPAAAFHVDARRSLILCLLRPAPPSDPTRLKPSSVREVWGTFTRPTIAACTAVAINLLLEGVVSDPGLKQRFEREAQTVAQLNHPHICTLHDIGSEDGTDFLVMEHLEGETLADRLSKGVLPLDQALKIAIEIADALDKAHRQRIVHRDLKPGNIMLTSMGAKLLDFGLAKPKTAHSTSSGQSETITIAMATQSAPLTGEGTILGTFQYMAPEQLKGKEADARTDIFALGAVIYEMITGTRAFEGESQTSLTGAILKDDPAASSELQPVSPASLERVVGVCLEKDAERR